MSLADVNELNRNAQAAKARLEPFYEQVRRVLVGQPTLIDRIVMALLCGGHVLLEGVPGLAKTLAARTVARGLKLSFSRIQFTPDLLPADLTGTLVFQPKTGDFTVKRGPIFANIVLADEINRAPAKVQSALLEAMQELQVTLGDETHQLPRPFLVLATQNPIEQEGTYPLPEAQLDRFLFKHRLDYPDRTEEIAILNRMAPIEPDLIISPVLDLGDITALREAVDAIYMDEKIHHYIVDLVRATRQPTEFGLDLTPWIRFGAGPRATLALGKASKAAALLAGRGFVTPDDVIGIAPDVLRHRIILTYEADGDEIGAEQIIEKLLAGVKRP